MHVIRGFPPVSSSSRTQHSSGRRAQLAHGGARSRDQGNAQPGHVSLRCLGPAAWRARAQELQGAPPPSDGTRRRPADLIEQVRARRLRMTCASSPPTLVTRADSSGPLWRPPSHPITFEASRLLRFGRRTELIFRKPALLDSELGDALLHSGVAVHRGEAAGAVWSCVRQPGGS